MGPVGTGDWDLGLTIIGLLCNLLTHLSTDLEVVSANPLRIPHLLRAGGEAELLTPPQHEDVVQLMLPPTAAALSLVQDPDNKNTDKNVNKIYNLRSR